MLYHTMYEIPWLLDNFLDQNYTALKAVGQLWLEIGRDIADSLVSNSIYFHPKFNPKIC